MRIAAKDLKFLRQVEELGQQGLTQEKIAERLGFESPSGIHRRLQRLGFRTANVPGLEVRVNLPGGNAGDRLCDLIERGELAAEEPVCEAAR